MASNQKILALGIPLILCIIGIAFIIYSNSISETLPSRMYQINLFADPVSNNLTSLTFYGSNFYYDFSLKEGYFVFESSENLTDLNIGFPSELVNSSLAVYTVKNCPGELFSYCNQTKIPFKKTVWEHNGSTITIPQPDYSQVDIIFKNFTVFQRYLIKFNLTDFEPEGVIDLYPYSRGIGDGNTIPLILNPDNNGNLMFSLGNSYDCKNCFYNGRNLKSDLWSTNKIIRLSMNQTTNPNSSFWIDAIPTKQIEMKNDLYAIGIGLAISMFTLFITLLLELKITDRK